MSRTVLVTGASGFVGSHLAAALVERGPRVRAMTRNPDDYDGAGEPVEGDISDPDSLTPLPGRGRRGLLPGPLARAATTSSSATPTAPATSPRPPAQAGLERIIYLGGLGRTTTTCRPHLRSRREVERLLAAGPVPVTVLRAAIVIGHGGISWEITRQLVEHLPAMVCRTG